MDNKLYKNNFTVYGNKYQLGAFGSYLLSIGYECTFSSKSDHNIIKIRKGSFNYDYTANFSILMFQLPHEWMSACELASEI